MFAGGVITTIWPGFVYFYLFIYSFFFKIHLFSSCLYFCWLNDKMLYIQLCPITTLHFYWSVNWSCDLIRRVYWRVKCDNVYPGHCSDLPLYGSMWRNNLIRVKAIQPYWRKVGMFSSSGSNDTLGFWFSSRGHGDAASKKYACLDELMASFTAWVVCKAKYTMSLA